MAMNELLYDEVLKAPSLEAIHTMWEGIVAKTEVGFIGKGGMLGKASSGCKDSVQSWEISTRDLLWEPVKWIVFIEQCAADLENAASVYSLKCGVAYFDFTDSDYMNILLNVLSDSTHEMMWRFLWFGDTEAKNVAAGGIITDGVDVSYFTLLDGFFNQMIAQMAVNPKQRVTITENAGATYAAQVLDPTKVIGYLDKVVKGAPLQIRHAKDKVLAVTQSVYDAYDSALSTNSACCTEGSRSAIIDGIQVLYFKGVMLQPLQVWDEMIEANENTGTKLNNPHRIVFTTKGVLAFGVDCESSFSDYDTWYSKDDGTVKTKGAGKLDVKLADPTLFMIGI